jgi:hypothetical protein
MKKMLSVLVALVLAIMPFVAANDVGIGIGIDIETEDFEPLVWQCDNRIVEDDYVEDGRETLGGDELQERIQNYAFEGELIQWDVLVMDKNGAEKVSDVYVTVGSVQGAGNQIEANCYEISNPSTVPAECNARIGEELISGEDFDSNTQQMYTCEFTVETPQSMQGEYWVTVEAVDLDGLMGTMDENEFWFFNPTIALSIDGTLDFGTVRPGTISYSETILLGNDAEQGSGVLLDMFISGTDFYDPQSSGAKCPVSNRLRLGDQTLGAGTASAGNVCDMTDSSPTTFYADGADHLCYFATNGAYSTLADPRNDAEGYVPIVYGDTFSEDFYNDAEIIQNDLLLLNGIAYDAGNVLTPGAEVALTFKLALPEPCNGDFNDGDIFFWGEAV